MASSNICSNPTRKVRVIAKIRGFTDQESESFDGSSAPWISVSKHNEGGSTEKVTISFGDKPAGGKYAYDMDYCYEQNEDFDLIFSREIKPLVSGVLDGQSASVIAYGARGSGKTCAIQGSVEKPGLATMAMTEILSIAEGIEKLITVSLYEVFHDHVYDLLDSNRPQVQVFENAQGKIELKGLSQVAIKSISEFHKLYFSGGCNSWKAAEKIGLKVPRRSHKGLMIHILSHDKNLNTKLVGKMNFVDLAGYEDARRSNSDSTNLGESSKINKSLYALMNVVYALNANESRVPYRESKLTRVLQDSIGGTNRVLMLTCLNSSFCQDTMHTVSLASRSFQVINRVTNSIKRSSKSSTKLSSVKNGKPASASTMMKKEATSQVRLLNKSSVTTNGRKLFHEADEGIPSTTPKQAKFSLNSASAILTDASLVMVSCSQKETKSTAEGAIASIEEEILLPTATKEAESSSIVEKEISTSPAYTALDDSLLEKIVSPHNDSNHKEATLIDSDVKSLTLVKKEDDIVGKENQSSLINEESPPLSARLRELSNNLKSLCSLTPKPQNITTPYSGQTTCTDFVEPKTPVIEQNMRANENWEWQRFQSPCEMFNNRSSGMKHSLVKDYLQFLNSASKEELKGLKGIGEKRATYILELREESPEPFKNLDDLQDIGLSAKQIKKMMKNVAGELFS